MANIPQYHKECLLMIMGCLMTAIAVNELPFEVEWSKSIILMTISVSTVIISLWESTAAENMKEHLFHIMMTLAGTGVVGRTGHQQQQFVLGLISFGYSLFHVSAKLLPLLWRTFLFKCLLLYAVWCLSQAEYTIAVVVFLYACLLEGDTVHAVATFDSPDADNAQGLWNLAKTAKRQGKRIVNFLIGRPVDWHNGPLSICKVGEKMVVDLTITHKAQIEELKIRAKEHDVEYQIFSDDTSTIFRFYGPQNIIKMAVKAVVIKDDEYEKELVNNGKKDMLIQWGLYNIVLEDVLPNILSVSGGIAKEEGISAWVFSLVSAFSSGDNVSSGDEYNSQKKAFMKMNRKERVEYYESKKKVSLNSYWVGVIYTYLYMFTSTLLGRETNLYCGGPFTAIARLFSYPCISFSRTYAMAFTMDPNQNILGYNFNNAVDQPAATKVFTKYKRRLGKTIFITTDAVKGISILDPNNMPENSLKHFTQVWNHSKPRGAPQTTFDSWLDKSLEELPRDNVEISQDGLTIKKVDYYTGFFAIKKVTSEICNDFFKANFYC